MKTDEDLYLACMNMCTDLFRYNIKKQKYDKRKMMGITDPYTDDRMMSYEKQRLFNRFDNLVDVIKEIKRDL